MRVAIAGAGDTGQAIARALIGSGHQVLLIERRRAAYRPELVPDADWLLADACEFAVLQEAGIDTCDVVIAASGDDKANLVFAMLCKTDFAVPRVVARINHPGNRALFTPAWGVDVAVSTPDGMVAATEEEVATGAPVHLLSLQRGSGRVVAILVPPGSASVGRTVGELPLPAECVVLAVIRGGTLAPAPAATVVRAGDEVLLLTSAEAEPRLQGLFTGTA